MSSTIRSAGTVVTIGSFDGLHMGHRQILNRVMNNAQQRGAVPMAVTFDPHPRSFLAGDQRNISMLYSLEERLKLIETVGIEHVYIIEFMESIRNLTPRKFVEQFFVKNWNAVQIVAGYDHTFGKDREGDHESLLSLGKEYGFQVEIAPPVIMNDQVVSSTAIRRLIMEGDLPLANQMLGRKFSLTGRVVRGFGRGRRLGCPTANLSEFGSGKIIPRDGIYAAIAETGGYAYPAAVSIGFNPTFGGQMHSVEAHILDFDSDLYDRLVTLRFVKRLRGEIKFSGEEALSAQMKQDVQDIRSILTEDGYSMEPHKLAPLTNAI
ncbi:bifunctional riboflavin kinase/FAD synthetase [bacterium]|nr:bifunctional riboflavin kinase/FAD synthetase [bacterium]